MAFMLAGTNRNVPDTFLTAPLVCGVGKGWHVEIYRKLTILVSNL